MKAIVPFKHIEIGDSVYEHPDAGGSDDNYKGTILWKGSMKEFRKEYGEPDYLDMIDQLPEEYNWVLVKTSDDSILFNYDEDPSGVVCFEQQLDGLNNIRAFSELAKEQVGDGKLPNKFFVSFGNSKYEKKDDEIVETELGAISIVAFMTSDYETAKAMVDMVMEGIEQIPHEEQPITYISIEDRQTGLVYEKMLVKKPSYYYEIIEDYHK